MRGKVSFHAEQVIICPRDMPIFPEEFIMLLRVAGAQLSVSTQVAENVQGLYRAVDFAAAAGADILLTPEGSLSGYTHVFNQREVAAALEEVTARARQAGVGLALGTCFVEPSDGRCYNQLRFYKKDGAYLGFHSKTLTCSTMIPPYEGESCHYSVKPLQVFDFDGIPIAGLICNDMWANPGCTPLPDPHLSFQLGRMGALVIFHAVNGGRDGSELCKVVWRYHESNLLLRAMTSRLWVVTVDNSAPPHLLCSAPSGVITPEGVWACQAEPLGEQFYSYTIELD